MAAGENSVQRANRMISELDAEIEFLRGLEIDASEHIRELQSKLNKELENHEEIRDRKMDALYAKQALMLFIRNGGGLDMYV